MMQINYEIGYCPSGGSGHFIKYIIEVFREACYDCWD
jgi:hypothetical protein